MNVIIEHVTLKGGHLVLQLCFGLYYVHALGLRGESLYATQRFYKLHCARAWLRRIAGPGYCEPIASSL